MQSSGKKQEALSFKLDFKKAKETFSSTSALMSHVLSTLLMLSGLCSREQQLDMRH